MFKRLLAIALALSLSFAACSCAGEIKQNYEAVGQITDGAGRTLDIRSDAKDSTIASVYAVAVPFFVALGIEDRVLAVNVKSNFWNIADPKLAEAGSVGRGVVDLEKLASYAPTALVHRSNDPETIEAVSKLGIDVVCITVEDMDDIKYTLAMLGEYFGVPENAQRASEWIDKKFSYIKSIVDTIPQSERKTALLMGGSLGRVAGSDMLQSWMIEQAGGIPVVREGLNHNWIDIGVEKIFAYDPDVIFCTSSTARDYTTQELLGDHAWSAMKSVINEDIYVIPAKYDSWDMPGISCVLGCMYMLREMYPDYFSLEDFEDEVDDYYRFMFGRCFDEELEIDWTEF